MPTQQPAPVPPKPTKPPEVATAKAELNIVLLPNEMRTRANSEIKVPADQAKRLVDTVSGLGHSALAVILVLGTLSMASSAHLSPIMIVFLIVVELASILGVAIVRRSPRNK